MGVSIMRNWLKKLREERAETQEDVARKLGITFQSYSYIENGKRRGDLNLSLMIKISELFGLTLEQIAELEKEKASG